MSLGGGGLHSNLSSCETFDGIEWERSEPLNVSRHALAITSIDNKIYAIGIFFFFLFFILCHSHFVLANFN